MIPVFRFVFIAIFVLAAMALRAQADSPIDADNAVRRTGVVLKAGAIDSSTVEVGALAVVIHGQGERQPVSGEWENLATARGYIQAVNVEALTLVLEGDHGAKQIPLKRIQTLVLIGSPSRRSPVGDRTQDDTQAESAAVTAPSSDTPSVRLESSPSDLPVEVRIAKKIVLGTGMGIVLTGGIFVQADDPLEGYGLLIYGIGVGCSVGFPLGVTLADPHDSFSKTMLAGVLPAAFGVLLTITTNDGGPMLLGSYLVPLFSSIIVSEASRKPPGDSAVSLGLSPTPHGGLSAVAKLRF